MSVSLTLLLTAERLREVLDYNPETGVFVWKIRRPGVSVGSIAGNLHKQGYRQIRLNRKLRYAHRLAWLYVHGVMPPQDLDHINGDRADNRIANLRLCNKSLNSQNRFLGGFGSTGYLGVTFNKRAKKYVAQITIKGFYKCLGLFDTALEAHHAYLAAKKTIHTFQGWTE